MTVPRSFKFLVPFFIFAISLFVFFALNTTSDRTTSAFQKQNSKIFEELRPVQRESFASGVSAEVSSFGAASPDRKITSRKIGRAEEQAREVPNKIPFRKQVAGAPHDRESAIAQILADPMPAPIISFEGISSNDNASAYGARFIPPDTNGDVGPDHYVQAVNVLIRVFDKQGNALTPPFKLSSVFAPLGTVCSTRNDGDPIVLYDPLADRWILSQFCNAFPPFRQMIAVSRTGDPTGSYHIYEFVMPNVKLNDYPKLAVWTDSYTMSTDEFLGGDYAGSGVFAFDKRKMLVGDPTASYIYFDLASPTTIRLGGLLPVDIDGIAFPRDVSPMFLGYTATEYGEPQDALRIFELRPNFLTYNLSTFAERSESPISVAAFDPTSNDGRADIRQPAPGDLLDSQSDRLMHRASFRSRNNFDSIVVAQTVRTSPIGQTYRAGTRVYELRRELSDSETPFVVAEQSTLSGGDISYWMGSAAMDHQGNLGFGYSSGSEEKKPSILYSGKLASDPVGSFRSPQALIEGTGVQTAFGFRWGDYSQISVDPKDDCTFWLTNQYYSQQSQEESSFGWLTRIGAFRFPECTDAPRAMVTGTVTDASNGQPIPNASVEAQFASSRTTDASGSFGTFRFLPDTYTFIANANGYREQTVKLTVLNGQTLTQNFQLQPTARIESTGTNIAAETCAANRAVDPGESVVLEVVVRNSGTRDVGELRGSLVSSPGITPQGDATQIFGALPVNAPGVSRPFSFAVSPNAICGSEITLQFIFSDGSQFLNSMQVKLRVGSPRIAFYENFDSARAPALPFGWTTSASGAQANWTTTRTNRQTIPNSAFSPSPFHIGLNELVSPSFQIASANAELSFSNRYELETTFLRNQLYDGGVLEIKIGDAEFQDIISAGGVFLSGGYDGVLSSCCQNPLAGRRAWSGRSGPNQIAEFVTSRVKLPPNTAGQNVRLRWRVGTDIGTFREGQYIDNILVTDGFSCCIPDRAPFVPFDFDGDGKTDLSVFKASDNFGEADFRVFQSSNSNETGIAWGSVGDHAANADYDGDGRTDYAVFRPSTNTWFVLRSSDSSIDVRVFGLAQDKLVPADFDGDAKSDIAVFRSGIWSVLPSSGSIPFSFQFGLDGDIPVQSDFDGDGKTDFAVFRPSTGEWRVLRSSNGSVSILRFGLSGDKPVVGDFDGDGKADHVVYRPSDQTWYLLKTRDGFSAARFGLSDDKPLQADFDGDGKRDIAVYRQITGVWYFIRSSNGSVGIVQFGRNAEIAVPGIYVE